MPKKKVWRKSLHRTEKWKGKTGKVKVTRNSKGRFVTWRKIRHYTRGKTAKHKWGTTVRRRAWTTSAFSGQKQIAVYSTVNGENRRYQIIGSGHSLHEAMKIISQHPPKEKFLTIYVDKLLGNPDDYISKKSWDRRPHVESR
jgi:hypothetical protein